MLYQALKYGFIENSSPKKKKKQAENAPLVIDKSPKEFIDISKNVCLKLYHSEHIFVKNYFDKLIVYSNSDLQLSIKRFVADFNFLQLYNKQYEGCMSVWSHDPQGLIPTLISIWVSYMEYELKQTRQVENFLRNQIFLIVQVLMGIFNAFHPQFSSKIMQIKLRLMFLNRISEEKLSQQMMNTFIVKLGKDKGIGGEFTTSQIQQSIKDLQVFFNFTQIQTPLPKSIELMKQFSKQYSIIKKIGFLLLCIRTIRNEVEQYQNLFNKKQVEFNGDTMALTLNYVCERSDENILASVHYLDAFLQHKTEQKQNMLMQIHEECSYNLTLVRAISSVKCHASKFL